MNVKTTIVLATLVVLGAIAMFFMGRSPKDDASGPTVQFLTTELTPKDLTRIEISRGDRKLVLEQSGPDDWTLPGKWPVRTAEVKDLVGTLTGLHTRFAPDALGEKPKLKEYGLDPAAVTVKVWVKGKEHTLRFGEEESESNRFSRATYVRLDDQKEVVRLAPGIVAALDRPEEFYRNRRLFPFERVAKDNDAVEKVEQVQAKSIAVKSPDATFELTKADDWHIASPVKDKADPDKLKSLLTALPDIWAERFVDQKDKKLEDFGLKEPQTVLTVTKPSGTAVKLLIGAESETKLRKTPKPAMPQQPFMPPKQDFDLVPEQYRFAKLEDNDQVFEIKADKLKDISVSLDSLRDAHLARFRTDQVKRLEIHVAGAGTSSAGVASGVAAVAAGPAADMQLVFVKEKDKWRMEKPRTEDAENAPVNDLLDKFAGLQARDKDVLDKVELPSVGLDKPVAVIKVTIEEEKGAKENKTKTPREVAFDLGVKEKDKDKLYVNVEGWPRVSAVDDAVLKLARRPDYVYRNRKVLDVAAADVGKVRIQRGDEAHTFAQEKGIWKLTAPQEAEVDSTKVGNLARDLAKLDAVEFVAESPKDEDLDKLYGLAKPNLSARLFFAEAKQEPRTLNVGKARGEKEYFARLDNGPVFVIRKDLYDELDRDSLSYRSLEVLKPSKDKIRELAIEKDNQEFRLVSDGKGWKVRGPFDADAQPDVAEHMVDELAGLRATRFVAHEAKDLAEYGLEKPYLTVRLVPSAKEDEEHQLLIGKTVDKEQARFAKLAKSPGVFVLAEKAVATLDHGPLDFLDKKLLSLDTKAIQKIKNAGPAPFTLEQKKDAWEVVDSPAPPFAAEEDAVQNALRPWANLRADRIAAYGPKIDWAAFGLDKPERSVTVLLNAEKEKEKNGKDEVKDKDNAKEKDAGKANATEHTIFLGKEEGKGQRYARVDKTDEVALLDAGTVTGLMSSHLDFVNHRVLKFDLDAVSSIARQMPGADLELAKRGDSWHFAKPQDKPADDPTLGTLLEKMFRLKAERIAAYPAKDLATYGLDNPAAVVTLKLTDIQGKASEHVVKVGKQADDKKDERYALIDKGDAVVVLGPELSKQLVAPALFFADRNLPGFSVADKAVVERAGRKVAFTHGDINWSMADPVKADAESAELDELTKNLRRLRAEEIVAEAPADLKAYGLEKLEAQWHLFDGDKEVMHLQVGSADKEGRRYGKLAGKDAVFTLNAKLSGKLLDEYRSRKPWPSLDAVQVEKLSYAGPAPFTLKKKDGDWILTEQTDAKVSSKQVTDTLDALAGLKAARYAADAKVDLKLYGLDPPVWTIDIETTSGKRTLHVGRAEGDSQRVYATVPGSDAVFIIGESEAQRILRPLAGFVEKK